MVDVFVRDPGVVANKTAAARIRRDGQTDISAGENAFEKALASRGGIPLVHPSLFGL
jgi:hypothetical protein